MVPRGGSAFLAELDGNLSCEKVGNLSVLKQCGKFRDVDFDPISFRREVRYPDGFGGIPTIIARYADATETAKQLVRLKEDDAQVVKFLAANQFTSFRDVAKALTWFLSSGDADGKKVERAIKSLRRKKAIDEANQLTEIGKELVG